MPHDVDGLMTLMGGKEAFVEKLDSLFMLEENLGAEMSPDITGLIGQYAHGNRDIISPTFTLLPVNMTRQRR